MSPTVLVGRLTVGVASGETDVLLLRRRLPWHYEHSINQDTRSRYAGSPGAPTRVVVCRQPDPLVVNAELNRWLSL
ncbi:MAG: hypothetical protein ACR2PK_17535 [Acidimicrobiales bacterium]